MKTQELKRKKKDLRISLLQNWMIPATENEEEEKSEFFNISKIKEEESKKEKKRFKDLMNDDSF